MKYYLKIYGYWYEILENEILICLVSLLATSIFSAVISQFLLIFVFCLAFLVFSVFSSLYTRLMKNFNYIKIEGRHIIYSFTTGRYLIPIKISFDFDDITKISLYQNNGKIVRVIIEFQNNKSWWKVLIIRRNYLKEFDEVLNVFIKNSNIKPETYEMPGFFSLGLNQQEKLHSPKA